MFSAADLTQEAEQHVEMWGEEDADQKKHTVGLPERFCPRRGEIDVCPHFIVEKVFL